MRRTLDDHLSGSPAMYEYIIAIFEYWGKDFTKCEFCEPTIPKDKFIIHHKKYEGATIYDLAIICNSCDKKAVNQNLI